MSAKSSNPQLGGVYDPEHKFKIISLTYPKDWCPSLILNELKKVNVGVASICLLHDHDINIYDCELTSEEEQLIKIILDKHCDAYVYNYGSQTVCKYCKCYLQKDCWMNHF